MAYLQTGQHISKRPGVLTRCMPDIKDLNDCLLFINPVVDLKRRMGKPPDSGKAFHPRAEVGKDLQQINVIEQGFAKSLAGFWMFFPRPTHYGFKIS